MTLPIGSVIGLMGDNLKKRKTVLPISKKSATRWAKGLDIPRGGPSIIYTGSMYQLLPYIIASTKNVEKVEHSFLAKFVALGRFFNRFINVSAFMAIPSRSDVKEFNQILRNIALLLREAGVEFGYLYEDEIYSGALAHDLGLEDSFREHARYVYSHLKEKGVRSLITFDPHTTHLMRSIYPTLIEGYDLEVRSYLEVLADKNIEAKQKIKDDVMIHDSCMYARGEGIIEEPRTLLRKAGYGIKEPRDSRELTHCCGGPIESLFPGSAARIGEKRVTQIANGTRKGVTMCPICLGTLRKASQGKIELNDISTYLARAYCGENTEGGL